MAKDERLVCAVDIGGTKVALALMDCGDGSTAPQAVREAEVPTCAHLGGEAVYQRIEDAVRAMLDAAPGAVCGVGIGSAGVIDPRTGSVFYANEIMPGWSGTALGPRLRAALGLPVAVLGDVQAHALGEARWGAGRGRHSLLCLGVGTGIGGAYVLEGRVLRGFHGAAGHMGHIESIAAAGRPCACGRAGHLESVASGTSMGALYDERFGRVHAERPSVGRDVSERAAAGDEGARGVLHDAGFALGASMGSLANILDPEVIVLSGGVVHGLTESGDPTWRDALFEGFQSQALDPLQDIPVVTGELGGRAPLIGAAEFLLDSLAKD